ncbi:hypothetical protein [Abyssicoccus albus]|uniref:Uncharacterized protein n=1 Tax=Abyssicoccus albus TaxID=1817405 RepID=A0A3N5BJB1_9BACL|nr:hypothetical protein [Abyssicoccus albus]RPF57713.1 hypothetical protein EDD62_0344 [Abyssicoccus albus]
MTIIRQESFFSIQELYDMAAALIIIPLVADAPLLWIGSIVAFILGLKKIEPAKDDYHEN